MTEERSPDEEALLLECRKIELATLRRLYAEGADAPSTGEPLQLIFVRPTSPRQRQMILKREGNNKLSSSATERHRRERK